MNYQHSLWEHDAWLNPTDLLIVGGGIVGASTALFYKQTFPDHDVLILDRGITPMGASTRNAGFTCIGSISEHLADINIAGLETVLNRIERRWNGLNLLRDTMGETQMAYENTGGYEIFTDSTIFERCRDQVEVMNSHLQKRLGLDNIYSAQEHNGYPAIFNRVEGAIHSGKLMRSLHDRLSRMGVRTLWNCKVSSVNPGVVELESGLHLKAKKTVLAVNGFASQLIDLAVKPARGYIFVTNPIPDLRWRGTYHYNEGYVYFRNIGDRLLLGGARNIAREDETTDQFGTNETIKSWLIDFANEVLKLPPEWMIEQEWSGIMGMTETKEPIIKEIQPAVFAAAGLSGMGIAIGMQVAKEVVEGLEE